MAKEKKAEVNENEEAGSSNFDFSAYQMVNEEKKHRAIFGRIGRQGQLEGGVGENASDKDILVEYDRLGGLIKKKVKGKDYVVKTGCFYDFKTKKAFASPKPIFLFKDVIGNTVEVPEGEDVPMEVKAAEFALGAKKKAKAKKKDEEDEVEEDVE